MWVFLIIIFRGSGFTDEGESGGASVHFFCCLLAFLFWCICGHFFNGFAPFSMLFSTDLQNEIWVTLQLMNHMCVFPAVIRSGWMTGLKKLLREQQLMEKHNCSHAGHFGKFPANSMQPLLANNCTKTYLLARD